MKNIFISHVLMLFLHTNSFASVRSIHLKTDELLTVKTALGIATIVQLPAPIQSAIIGDQSAFRVEHLDKAVTIKPLRYGARTNLYLLTDGRRYNLKLVTLSQESADFIVYVKEKNLMPVNQWKPISLSKSGKNLTLSINRIGKTPQGFILIEGKLTSKNHAFVKPEQIWVKQGKDSKVIQHLYLSAKSVSTKSPLVLGISLGRGDLDKKSIEIEIQGQETVSLSIAEKAWR